MSANGSNGATPAVDASLSRALVENVLAAIASSDAACIAPYLDDDIDFMISGPADLFDYYGLRRGNAAVIELLTRIRPCFFHVARFEVEDLLIHGERAAAFSRLCGIQTEIGREIRFRCAQFMQFRGGKLVWFRSVADSLDAAEQLVGHPIELDAATGPLVAAAGKNVVAI